jgi:hypothetical protein
LVNSVNSVNSTSCQWQQLLDNNGNPLPVDVSLANLTLKVSESIVF